MVEQSWDQITVKFYNRDYFSKFVESLMGRYPALRVWNDPRRQPEGSVTSCSGLQVRLSLCPESRSLSVDDLGASSWVMGDFQTICKNISVTGSCKHYHRVSTGWSFWHSVCLPVYMSLLLKLSLFFYWIGNLYCSRILKHQHYKNKLSMTANYQLRQFTETVSCFLKYTGLYLLGIGGGFAHAWNGETPQIFTVLKRFYFATDRK